MAQEKDTQCDHAEIRRQMWTQRESDAEKEKHQPDGDGGQRRRLKIEPSRAVKQNSRQRRIGQRCEQARPPPAEAPERVEHQLEKRVLVDDRMTEISDN